MRTIKFLLAVILAVGFAIGVYSIVKQRGPERKAQNVHQDIYYCPMHPSYTSDKPGTCPICNMNLVKRKTEEVSKPKMDSNVAAVAAYSPVQLDVRQQQLLGVRTVTVEKKPAIKTIRAVGYVVHNLELYQVQNEFIDAYQQYTNINRDYRRVSDRRRSWEPYRQLQSRMLEAEHKLATLGLGSSQIAQLRNVKWWQAWNQPDLLFFKDSQNYWVFAQVFESDLGFVDVGQKVQIEIPAYFEHISGIVRSVGGIIDPETRSVRVLIEVEKYRGELTANMLAYVTMPVELDTQILVSQEALMDLGTRKIVFVEKSQGQFEPREIEVGFQGDGYWAIKKGLNVGERVVISGNFLLDSESRLKFQMSSATDNSRSEVGHVKH